MDIPNEKEIDKEFEINDASPFTLSEELKNYSKQSAKYIRWAARANKRVAKLILVLKITEGEIFHEIIEKESYPPSSYSEVRRLKVPLNYRYQKVAKVLRDAQETAEILNGYLRAWEARGYRLMELAKISEKMMWNEPRVYQDKEEFKPLEDKIEEAGGKLELE